MFNKVSQFARRVRDKVTGERVFYEFLELAEKAKPIRITATRGRSDQPTASSDRLRLPAGQMDWLVARSQLSREPLRGDRIIVGKLDGKNKQYEVAPYDNREECWVPSDSYEDTYRIHTKEV